MRRARIVSEPVTDYIRWEHAVTPMNIEAGEQVRWLPRRRASDIALPGNDLWLIDRRLVMFHFWTGEGDWAGHEFTEEPSVVKLVTDAFETVWERGTPTTSTPSDSDRTHLLMASSPSSSAQAAREALAMRLSHLRKDAGLTGRELSARCGWHPAKTTRLQKGEIAASDSDIRAWCAATDSDDQAADLIATARAVDSMYQEWRRLHRNGMRKAQEDWSDRHRQARICRTYVSNVVPGYLQTPRTLRRSCAASPPSRALLTT